MSLLFIPKKYSVESKREAVASLLENTVPDRDFYLLVIGAIILASCGILTDSIPVLIASMIVAPLAYPILSMALAIPARDGKLFLRSLFMLLISIALAIIVAGFFSLFAKSYFDVAERVFISFFPNVFFDLMIAIVAGVIAAYGLIRVKVGEAMTGIGIAVSLMPPLVATGIGLFDPVNSLAFRAGSIFLLNVAGILAGSMITFLIFGLYKERGAIKNNLN
ncbi:DUF389 domain-containing protein [Candidatus Wolfebacteria bacterium]|nr:DUF389 domain-containing protein [Candidatus Wolfebacteria bacterium]